MEELKRCPFCGGKASYFDALGWCAVQCDECHATTRSIQACCEYSAKEKVIEAWNRRVNDGNT